MESNRVARQSFGMLKIREDRILFELCLWEKDERRKKVRKKERKMNKIAIFNLSFSNLLKVRGTFGVV